MCHLLLQVDRWCRMWLSPAKQQLFAMTGNKSYSWPQERAGRRRLVREKSGTHYASIKQRHQVALALAG